VSERRDLSGGRRWLLQGAKNSDPRPKTEPTKQSRIEQDADQLDKPKIVSLDPRYSDEEIARMSVMLENEFSDLFNQSRYEEARSLVQKAIDSLPKNWKAVEEREDCLIRAFWVECEYFAYQRAHPNPAKPLIWGQPSIPMMYYAMGATYREELRPGLAHACLLKGREYEPDHPLLWSAEGTLLNWENRFTEAIEVFRKAIGLRSWMPSSVIAGCIHGQGVALGRLGRLPEARDAFESAVEIDPDCQVAKRDLERVVYDLWKIQKQMGAAPDPAFLM